MTPAAVRVNDRRGLGGDSAILRWFSVPKSEARNLRIFYTLLSMASQTTFRLGSDLPLRDSKLISLTD